MDVGEVLASAKYAGESIKVVVQRTLMLGK